MGLADVIGLVIGFSSGWIAAMIYYRRLCWFTDAAKHLFVGVWSHRPFRADRHHE